MDVETTETVIVGAGPAGLAVAACLRETGRPFVLVERADAVGSAWRGHYDRLHLHTDKARSHLPFVPFARDVPRYPSRDQVVAYLDEYARRFDLAPRLGREVLRIRREREAWETTADGARWRSSNVVVATGNTRVPFVPDWPGRDRFRGDVVHSAGYRSGAPYRDRRVLVVGLGNSGGEIAIDLVEHGARVALAVRSPVNVIPKELFGVPILSIAAVTSVLPAGVSDALMAPIFRLRFGRIEDLGLSRSAVGPRTQVVRRGKVPLIDVGTIARIRAGDIAVRPGIERFDADRVRFVDGASEAYDAVVLATGYRPRVDRFVDLGPDVLDPDGRPRVSGAEIAPGLYSCGFEVSPRGALFDIAREARRIAASIAARPSP